MPIGPVPVPSLNGPPQLQPVPRLPLPQLQPIQIRRPPGAGGAPQAPSFPTLPTAPLGSGITSPAAPIAQSALGAALGQQFYDRLIPRTPAPTTPTLPSSGASSPSATGSATSTTDASALRGYATSVATKYGIDPTIFVKQGQAESGFNPNAVSSAGALGPYQLMPATAKGLGVDPNNPYQNIDGGARYLKQQLDRYHGSYPLALAAFNAGPGAVDAYVAGTADLPDQTKAYVKEILGVTL